MLYMSFLAQLMKPWSNIPLLPRLEPHAQRCVFFFHGAERGTGPACCVGGRLSFQGGSANGRHSGAFPDLQGVRRHVHSHVSSLWAECVGGVLILHAGATRVGAPSGASEVSHSDLWRSAGPPTTGSGLYVGIRAIITQAASIGSLVQSRGVRCGRDRWVARRSYVRNGQDIENLERDGAFRIIKP